MKGPRIKKNKIPGLSVDFEDILKRMFSLILFRNNKPIIFQVLQFFAFKIIVMLLVTFGYADKPTFFLASISKTHYTLIAPQKVFSRRLVSMQECIVLSWSIFPLSVHEAKAIERRFEFRSLPDLFEDGSTEGS